MYTIIKNKIRYQFTKQDNSKLTYAEFINLLKNKDENFLELFRQEIKKVPGELSRLEPSAYFWKCVPVSSNTLNKEFEFVVIKEEELDDMRQDYSSFQGYFNRNSDVVNFSSRSGDTLIVPTPKWGHQYSCNDYDNDIHDYKNLRRFASETTSENWSKVWQKVGEELEKELLSGGNNTRWLNTHGLAVPYLHIRLDKSAKYYQGAEEYQVETQYQQENPSETQPDNPQSQKETGTLKVVLITGGIIVGLSFLAFIFYHFSKKKKKQ